MSRWLLAISMLIFSGLAHATLIIPIYFVNANGQGVKMGTIKADDTIYGILLTPNLRGLDEGAHGFHLHALPFCTNYGRASGGHYDPEHDDQHHGPFSGNGHLGDLPVLIADEKGKATLPVLAPRLQMDVIKGKTLVIDSDGDNYSDTPHKNGGGGALVACGTVPYFNKP